MNTEKKGITFEKLVQFGKDSGANIVNGMPWSFQYKGHPVSHERDDCYLITMANGENVHLHPGEIFTPDETLNVEGRTDVNKISMLLEQYIVTQCPKCNEIHFEEKSKSAVRCGVCGKFHLTNSNDYVAVSGNITLGLDRGVIGNNIGEGGVVKKVSTFCPECFITTCTLGAGCKEPILAKEEKPKGAPELKDTVTHCPYNFTLHDDYKVHEECEMCNSEYPISFKVCGDNKNESNS